MIYLDHAATTPLDPAVLEAMLPYLRDHFGNASSVHAAGRRARVAVEEARERVAGVLGCAPAEVVFTSGGTEADNLALRGALAARRAEGRTGLVTGAAEHEAVLRTAYNLAEHDVAEHGVELGGGTIRVLPPAAHGAVLPDAVADAMNEQTALVSFMLVNNELGTVTDIAAVARVAQEAGALVHTDAVQAAGVLPLDVDALGVDLLALSAHKCGGPKGVGALFVRAGTPLAPLVTGGAQERRRRGGTENVAGVVGFAEALARAEAAREHEAARLAVLRNRLAARIAADHGEGVRFNTPLAGHHAHPAPTAPHILNVAFSPREGRAVDGEMLLLGLDVAGVCASSGSACTSGALEPSHVLLALGLDRSTAAAAVRFSLGRSTAAADVDAAADALRTVVARLR